MEKSRITFTIGKEKVVSSEKDEITNQTINITVMKERTSSISTVKHHVMKYSNCMHRLIHLSPFDRAFLDFLCERMDDQTNAVYTTAHFRSKFLETLESSTGIKRSAESVKKAIAKLKKHHLLIDFGQRNVYVVNPRHFYKGSEESRKKIIRQYLEWIFSEKKENDHNFKEAFGLTDELIKFAKNLIRI